MSHEGQRLTVFGKIRLALRIWFLFFDLQLRLRRYQLPQVVDQLSRSGPVRRPSIAPRWLGIIVYRVLHIGPFRARCLLASLVLFRLMIEQGDAPPSSGPRQWPTRLLPRARLVLALSGGRNWITMPAT